MRISPETISMGLSWAHARTQSFRASREGRKPLHFIHVGKTGGSAIKEALSGHELTREYRIVLHEHAFRLAMVPAGEQAFLFLRDPASRFVSGFNSRMRKGQPRYYYEWTRAEKTAFTLFKSAEELALALGSSDSEQREDAETAMRAIQHVRDSYDSLFGGLTGLQALENRIAFVGFHNDMTAGFESLKTLAGLPGGLQLPGDEIGAHRAPAGISKRIGDEARANVRKWYAEDYRIYDYLHGKWPTVSN